MESSCKEFKKHVVAHYNGNNGVNTNTETGHQLYQTSIMSALINSVYEGETTFAELEQHGNFGLGTFNDLDGEMVAIDGKFYQLRSDGMATLVSPGQKTPFAAVSFFKEMITYEVNKAIDNKNFQNLLNSLVPSENLFYGIRVEGQFSMVKTRTVALQQKPFKPLTEVAEGQATFSFTDISGTLAGYRSPDYAQGLSVAGYHLHFIDSERKQGGHVLDFTLYAGKIMIDIYSSLHIALPQTMAFEHANLSKDNSNAIKKAEG